MLKFLVDAFPLWLFGASLIAFLYPPSFLWLNLKTAIDPMLGVVMLAMGLSLTIDDFYRIARRPGAVMSGVLLQFTIMPAVGFVVAQWFELETPLAVGLILVSCCPGGTASNVVSYIARADVALSVSMTTVSTISAVIVTPLLTTWLAGSRVDVEPVTLIMKVAVVVLIPVIVGLGIRQFFPAIARVLIPVAPTVAMLTVVIIVAGIVASMNDTIRQTGGLLIAAVGCVHVTGAALGYLLGRLLTRREQMARTTAIEVGMQNGGLAISLATSGAFAAASLVALPGAFSGLTSCLIGSVLAAVWSRRPVEDDDQIQPMVPSAAGAAQSLAPDQIDSAAEQADGECRSGDGVFEGGAGQ